MGACGGGGRPGRAARRPGADGCRRPVTAEAGLDLEQAVEQGVGIEAGVERHCRIEEVRVGGQNAALGDGPGRVKLRDRGHVPELPQAVDRGVQIRLSTAEVRTERDEGASPGHGWFTVASRLRRRLPRRRVRARRRVS